MLFLNFPVQLKQIGKQQKMHKLSLIIIYFLNQLMIDFNQLLNFPNFLQISPRVHKTTKRTIFVKFEDNTTPRSICHFIKSVKNKSGDTVLNMFKQRSDPVSYRNVTMVILVTSFAVIFLLPLRFHRGHII